MTAPDLVNDSGRAYREGRLDRQMKVYLARMVPKVLVIDVMWYLPLDDLDATIFLQLVGARNERGSSSPAWNKSYVDWGEIFWDPVIATAILDRRLHHLKTLSIRGKSYRLEDQRRAGLLPATEEERRPPVGLSTAPTVA